MADDVEIEVHRHNPEESPGSRLRRARKSKKLTTREIARKLHMDSWMLDAIERDEFSALGAPVFAKGHLRKYAIELGIEPDDLMVGYYQVAGSRETPPLIAESILRMEAANGPRIAWLLPTAIVFAAVASVAAGAMWFLRSDSAPGPVSTAEASRSADDEDDGALDTRRSAALILPSASAGTPVPAESQIDTSIQDEPEAVVVDEPAAPEPARVAAVETTTVAEPVVREPPPAPAPRQAPVASGSVTLTLRFREESWVEVYDAQRNKLLYGMGAADTSQYLSGPPPLQVFLGRYRDVDVEVNGSPYDIPRESRRTNTARFRVDDPSR